MPVADEVARGLAAEDEAEGGEQQALAGAGLAGPGTVAGPEVDPGVFDQGEVLHGEFAEHGSSSSEAGPGPVASTRRMVVRTSLLGGIAAQL